MEESAVKICARAKRILHMHPTTGASSKKVQCAFWKQFRYSVSCQDLGLIS